MVRTSLSNKSDVSMIYGCKYTKLKSYFKEFSWAVDQNSLPTVDRILKGFSIGNKVDFTSYFDLLINRVVIGKDEYVPRKAATILVDNLLLDNDLYKNNKVFSDFEMQNREKIGPYSIRLPFIEFVERGPCEYFNFINPSKYTYDKSILEVAVRNVSSILPLGSLRPISLNEAFDRSDKTTNWGAPYFWKGNDLVEGRLAASYYFDLAKSDLDNLTLTHYPNMMFMRTQPSGTIIPKQRVAFGVPHSVTLIESTLQVPLLSALKFLPQFSENLSQDAFNEYATNLFRDCDGSGINIIGFDASGYN